MIDITLSKTYDSEHIDRALVYGERAHALSPNNPEVYWLYGQLSVYAQHIDLARTYFAQAVLLEPKILYSQQLLLLYEHTFGTKKDMDEAYAQARKYFSDAELNNK